MKNMNTKRLLLSATALLMMLLFLNPVANAQVLISDDGATNPAEGAALEVRSTSKGFLMPRLATTAVSTPVAGMMIIATDNSNAVMVYSGSEWVEVGSGVTQTEVINLPATGAISTTITGKSVVGVWAAQNDAGTDFISNFSTTGNYLQENETYTEVIGGFGKLKEIPVYEDIATNTTYAFGDDDGVNFASGAFADDGDLTRFKSISSPSVGTPVSIGYNFQTPTVIKQYSINPKNSGTSPVDWTFEGYDGSWNLIESKSGQSLTPGEANTFTTTNTNTYTQYRIMITAIGEPTWKLTISEIEFKEESLEYDLNRHYITTSDAGNLDASITGINSITITDNDNDEDDIKYAVSFDGRSTWNYYDGSGWQNMALTEFMTKGSSKSQIETGLSSYSISCSSVDVAISLKTSDKNTVASVDNIILNYSTGVTYQKASVSDFSISRSTASGTQTITITNKTGSSASIVIDYIK